MSDGWVWYVSSRAVKFCLNPLSSFRNPAETVLVFFVRKTPPGVAGVLFRHFFCEGVRKK